MVRFVLVASCRLLAVLAGTQVCASLSQNPSTSTTLGLGSRFNYTLAQKNSSFILREWDRVSNFSIVYNKIQKCSSSTVGGVFRTIGLHRNARPDTDMPFLTHLGKHLGTMSDAEAAQALHEPFVLAMHEAAGEWHQLRPRVSNFLNLPVFVATWLRDPIERCYSAYYFFEVREDPAHVDNAKRRLNYIKKSCQKQLLHHLKLLTSGNRELTATATSHQPSAMSSGDESTVEATVAKLLGEYHFVGLTERFDESLVALKWILGLEMGDILHISSKRPGMLDGKKRPLKSHIDAATEPDDEIVHYLNTTFAKQNAVDFAFVEEANRQLDVIIAQIPAFGVQLHNFRVMQAAVADKCWTATPLVDCTCLFSDNACCVECVDSVSPSMREILAADALKGRSSDNFSIPTDLG